MAHQLENSKRALSRTHPSDKCVGQTCTIHNMSDHPYRAYEQVWTGAYMERISPNREVWPDPDDPRAPARPNAARCMECGTLLYSRFAHDFKECPCSNLFVDGGSAYHRMGWRDDSLIEVVPAWPVPGDWR